MLSSQHITPLARFKDMLTHRVQDKLIRAAIPLTFTNAIVRDLLNFHDFDNKIDHATEFFLDTTLTVSLHIIIRDLPALKKANLLNDENISYFILHLNNNHGDLKELAERNLLTQEMFQLLLSIKDAAYLNMIIVTLYDNHLLLDNTLKSACNHKDLKSLHSSIETLTEGKCLIDVYLDILLVSANPISMANGCIIHFNHKASENISKQELLSAVNALNPSSYIMALYTIKTFHAHIPDSFKELLKSNDFLTQYSEPDLLIRLISNYELFDNYEEIVRYQDINVLANVLEKIRLAGVPARKYFSICISSSYLKEIDAILDFMRGNIFNNDIQKNSENIDSLFAVTVDNSKENVIRLLAKFSRRYLSDDKINQSFYDDLIKEHKEKKQTSISKVSLFKIDGTEDARPADPNSEEAKLMNVFT